MQPRPLRATAAKALTVLFLVLAGLAVRANVEALEWLGLHKHRQPTAYGLRAVEWIPFRILAVAEFYDTMLPNRPVLLLPPMVEDARDKGLGFTIGTNRRWMINTAVWAPRPLAQRPYDWRLTPEEERFLMGDVAAVVPKAVRGKPVALNARCAEADTVAVFAAKRRVIVAPADFRSAMEGR